MRMPMTVLLLRANDPALRSAFAQFRAATGRMGAPGLTFPERLKITTAVEQGARRVEQRLGALHRTAGQQIHARAAALFDAIPDMAERNLLMNGLYTPAEFAGMVDRHRQSLPAELRDLYQVLADTAAGEGDYLLFWNLGEAEARALLSDQGD